METEHGDFALYSLKRQNEQQCHFASNGEITLSKRESPASTSD